MKKSAWGFALLAVMVGLSLSSCSRNANTLFLYTWTYYTPEDAVRRFEEKYNCTVRIDTYDSNEVMYAKLKAGATGYDIVFPSQDYAEIMIKQDMVQEIDHSQFENSKYINKSVLTKTTYDPTMKYAVPYYMGAAGIAVNKLRLKDYPRDWSIFSDPRIAGHATMMDDMREVLGDALAHLGYSVNSDNDAELRAATDLVINEWKPNLVRFDAEGFGKSFANGDFWVCQGYAEVVFGEVPEDKQDDMIDFFIPAEGGPMYIDSMMILKGAKHYDLAMKFINFITEPENYAEFLDGFRFPASINAEAAKYMTEKPIYRADEMENCELKMDLAEGLYKYNELWQEIRFTSASKLEELSGTIPLVLLAILVVALFFLGRSLIKNFRSGN